MSKFKASKKFLLLFCPIAVGLLGMQAEAKPVKPNLPPIPPASIPHHPRIVIIRNSLTTPGGLSPAQLTTAYNLPTNNQGQGETIALVEAGDDPNIESDLNVFSAQFGLPACTTANGCFKKVFADDTPPPDSGWAVETSLDVEWAHAIAPHEGVWYPSASPYVTAVGGTQLTTDASGNYVSEVGWSGSGGGVSVYETEPSYQTAYAIPQANGFRGVPDVSLNASGSTPYAVYDSFGEGGWIQVAGTSASTPVWAGIVAVMKSSKNGNFAKLNQSLYSVARETNPLLFHDILTGNNGSCGYFCQPRSGYDYVTGIGTPMATALVNRFK
jgi:subtilase family serine protease